MTAETLTNRAEDATRRATRATAYANWEGSAEANRDAQEAHAVAANFHRNAAVCCQVNSTTEEHHLAHAKRHREMMTSHANTAYAQERDAAQTLTV